MRGYIRTALVLTLIGLIALSFTSILSLTPATIHAAGLRAAADPFEPDGSCQQAQPLLVNSGIQTHTFSTITDTDWISFTAQAGKTYAIQAGGVTTTTAISLALSSSCTAGHANMECQLLPLQSPGFEGAAQEVFEFWKAGGEGAFQRSSAAFYSGSFALRMHASLGTVPCSESILRPYLYQVITLPQKIAVSSTLNIKGAYRIEGSLLTCSVPNQPDVDDLLQFSLVTTEGTTITPKIEILNGGELSQTWHLKEITPTNYFTTLSSYAGTPLQFHWAGFNDADMNGTFFYLDDLEAQLCQPIPEINTLTYWTAPSDGIYYLRTTPGNGAILNTDYTLSVRETMRLYLPLVLRSSPAR